MGTLLDTSVLIALERGYATVPPADQLGMAAISVSELLYGVHRSDDRHRAGRLGFVERVIADVPVVSFDRDMARIHAHLRSAMDAAGARRNTHDLIIAATAISLGWHLGTVDHQSFAAIPGLELRYL